MAKLKLFIFPFLVIVFINNSQIQAQEPHEYAYALACDLSEYNFVVKIHGYVDSLNYYHIYLESPKTWDEELTRSYINLVLRRYQDVEVYEPWEASYRSSKGVFRIDDTKLTIRIRENIRDHGRPQGCSISMSEHIYWQPEKASVKRHKKGSRKKSTNKKHK